MTVKRKGPPAVCPRARRDPARQSVADRIQPVIDILENPADLGTQRPDCADSHDDDEGQQHGEEVPPAASESRNFALLEYDTAENKVDPKEHGPVLCFMASTSAGAGKSLNTMLRQVDGPIFRMIVEITTAAESNTKGSFHVYKVRSLGEIDWDLGQNLQVLAAYYEAFRKMNAGGQVKTAEAGSD